MLPMAVARFPYGGVVIRRVLPVLWMTSYLHISQSLLDVAAQLRRSSHAALGLAINGAYGIPVAGNGRTGLLLTVGIGGSTGGGVCLRSMTALLMQCVLPIATARSSSGAVAIRYVLPVLLDGLCLHIHVVRNIGDVVMKLYVPY